MTPRLSLYQSAVKLYDHKDYIRAKDIIKKLFLNYRYNPELSSPDIYFKLGKCFINDFIQLKNHNALMEAIICFETFNFYNRLKYKVDSQEATNLIKQCYSKMIFYKL